MKSSLLPVLAAVCGAFTIAGSASADIVTAWTKTSPADAYWADIATSADGTKVAAANAGGNIYLSTNSGTTWTPTSLAFGTGDVLPHRIASSADGSKLVEASGETIYSSSDSGATWVLRKTIIYPLYLAAIASSADGTKLVAADYNVNGGGGDIYTSTDSGTNWTARMTGQLFAGVASSADGLKLAAAAGNQSIGGFGTAGDIYTSTNAGTNWSMSLNSSYVWTDIACSADGTTLLASEISSAYASAATGQLHVSTNFGASWPSGYVSSPALSWQGVSCSTNGSLLISMSSDAASYCPGLIFTSTNYGASWQLAPAPYACWSSLASSADGTKLFATAVSGLISTEMGIWTYAAPSTAAPTLNLATAGGRAFVSWPWPSAGFVLQQNTNLAATNWVTMSGPPAVVNQMIVPATNNNNFYRLIHP